LSYKSTLALVLLAAIWGSSFIFMRATAGDFGPVFLITIRSGVAALCLVGVFLATRFWQEFKGSWSTLAWIGILNSALPFTLLAFASLELNAGLVAIINATTPLHTALIAHFWLKDRMSLLQFSGLMIAISGIVVLFWDKLLFDIESWWPVLAGLGATLSYGIAINATKKNLKSISPMAATAGSMLFAGLAMALIGLFHIPDFANITALDWSYAVTLGIVCTALAYVIFFRLIQSIGSTSSASVTFLVPIFAFIWAHLLLGETLNIRMILATAIILFGTALVTKIIRLQQS
jgi:drug/metabolite transporter (DMT)-like permease